MIRFAPPEYVSIPKQAIDALIEASPAALRLYLFGLAHERADLSELTGALSLKREELLLAMEELENRGLLGICVQGETTFTYLAPAPVATNAPVYPDAQFNARLQSLFTDRLLTDADFKLFYECIDVYSLPREVVLMLAEHCIGTHKRKNRLPISYIRDRARAWAQEGIDTPAAAEKRMREGAAESGCAKVLRSLGIRGRYPTDEEERLYQVWTREWGATDEAIAAAMRATASSRNPNMSYLNSVLRSMYEKGLLSGDAPERIRLERETEAELKAVKKMLGAVPLTFSQEERSRYDAWRAAGFSQGAILLGAKACAARERRTMEALSALLLSWKKAGVCSESEISALLRDEAALSRRVRAFLDRAGVTAPPSPADLRLYRRFESEYGMSEEVILFAAECAHGSANALRYAQKLLLEWSRAGVSSVSAAEAERAKHHTCKKPVDYSERDYAPGELSAKVHNALDDVPEEGQK